MTKDVFPQIPLKFERRDSADMVARAKDFRALMEKRRTVRDYSAEPIPESVILDAVATANTAPSGANKQPWHFAIIKDPEVKRKIREAAEEEERAFYSGRHGMDWVEEVARLGTDEHKPFLETAPYLIILFRQPYGLEEDGTRDKHYYVPESCGIAAGMLISALHNAGLATLTHTPNPMAFLSEICGRPKHEKAMMIVVAGLPAKDAQVPGISKKGLDEKATLI
ncbi:MAG: nitroreductase family protein [Sphingomonadales bacterium]